MRVLGNKLDRYIIGKFLGTFVFMVMVFILLIVVIDVAEKIDDFIERKAPMQAILFDYYQHFIPFIINLLSPVCVFLSVIFFTAQMTQKSEVVAILSSGTSFYRLLVPYLGVAILLALLSFYLNGFVVPHGSRSWMAFEDKYVRGYRPFEGKNVHKKIDANSFIYLYSFNQYDNQGFLVTIEERRGTRLKRKVTAQNMQYIDSLRRWRMFTVTERAYLPEGEHVRTRQQVDTIIKLKPNDIYIRENQAKSLTMPELREYILLERERGSDFLNQLELEWQERFAYPVAALILTVIGVALSTKRRRGGIGLQIGLGLILIFLYILFLNTAKVVLGDSFPPWVAIWLPNLLFLGIAAFLIRVAPK